MRGKEGKGGKGRGEERRGEEQRGQERRTRSDAEERRVKRTQQTRGEWDRKTG